MNQRFLMLGFASLVFVVTLGVSSWHEGLWTSNEPAVPAHRARPVAVASEDDITPIPAHPFGPDKPTPTAVPAIAAVTPPPPPPTPQVETPPPPSAEAPSSAEPVQDMDEAEFRAHEERAAQRGARTR